MKLKNIMMASVLALSSTMVAQAAQQFGGPQPERFRAQEFSADLFGSVSVGQETINDFDSSRIRHDGRLGMGIGVNYFVSRNLGVGVDAYTENAGHSFVDNVAGSIIYRFPFEIGLAPYVYGGGGHQFDFNEQWFAHAGGGLEWRFHRNWGIFLDARYVFTDGTRNFGVGRLGMRYAF